MAAHSFQDSNYGSLSLQSSSSSFTMSLSESEADYLPSTSGCSSDLPYPKRVQLKEKRKEQVKKYLKQLKSMVPQPHGNKMGTLSALQHVVDSFKKIKEDGENPAVEKPAELLENELNLTTFEGQDDLSLKIVKLHECIYLTVELPDLVVVKVSANFKNVLGYPTDAWMGRCLDDFVHRWDVVTMKSSIAINRDPDITPDTVEDKDVFPKEKISVSRLRRKVFYFRLRLFKDLKNGYNIQNDSKYQAFQACLSIAPKPDPGIELDIDIGKYQMQQECLILQCTPLKSVYEVTDLPEKDLTFHTRHNLFCSYSHIDPKAITILGYLPQDVIGTSIFNFYHVDDMELLYNIYQQILVTSKTPFKSMPFRFRMRNGGWVFVETEWSSFVNPWTHKLDFVIGKHTVVKSQNSALKNLSSENLYNSYFKEQDIVWGEKSMKYQSSIRELLLQPLSGLSAQFDIDGSQPKSSDEQSSEKPMLTEDEEGVSLNNVSVENPKADKAKRKVTGGLCNAQICDDEISVAYEQLNYTSNIKRFLLSQPNSFSPSTFKKSSAEESSETGESVLEVDISVPKPPSFGSSTKVLVSEQEQREEVALSPAVIPADEENLKEAAIKEALTQPSGVMTQKSLFEHTRQQEQLFVQEAKQDRNLIVLKRNCPQVSDISSLCLKRSHSPDRINDRQCRAMKSMKPLYGVQIPEGSGMNLVKGNTMSSVTSGQPVFVPVNIGQPGFSFMQVDPTSGVPNVMVSSPMTSTNIPLPVSSQQVTSSVQWPYYPQSGVSFIPQVMGGFYQSGMGLTVNSQPVHLGALVTSMPMQTSTSPAVPSSKLISATSSLTADSNACHDQPQYSQAGEDRSKKIPTDFLSSSSFEESSSSLYYLLESEGSSANISSGFSVQEQHVKRKKKKAHSRIGLPPWLMGIKWTTEVQMLYKLPKPRKSMIMKRDRDFLCKIHQPEQVISQFQIIDEEVTQLPPNIEDEESDYLLWPECYTETDRTEKPLKCMSGHCDHDDHVEDAERSSLYCDEEEGESSGKGFDLSNISSNGDDASSSKSSDLTASDERSNEEMGSSLKESDACSSDQGSFGDQKCSCDTEVETNIPETPNIKFDNYFSMLPVEFSSDEKNSPFWLQNSIFNDKVAMKYCLETVDLEKQLQEDRKKLEAMEQSASVLSHFNELIGEMSEASGMKIPLSSEQSSSVKNDDSSKTTSHVFDSFFESMFSLLVPGDIVSPVTDGLGSGDISDSFMDTVD